MKKLIAVNNSELPNAYLKRTVRVLADLVIFSAETAPLAPLYITLTQLEEAVSDPQFPGGECLEAPQYKTAAQNVITWMKKNQVDVILL